MVLRLIKTPDGRTLAVETLGDPQGRPVFLLHGTPGSRLGPAPRGQLLYRLGIRLITFDRPGYGDSDRLPDRRVAAAAEDVRAIADALGLRRFAVVGRSGGGPHALACAALLGQRVTQVAALVCLAPWDAEGLDWYAAMTESNIRAYKVAELGHAQLAPGFEFRSRRIRDDPSSLLAGLRKDLPESDLGVVADAGLRRMLESNYREAFRHSADGWIDDALAFTTGWGFKMADIAVPVWLWHGADDMFSPTAHSHWLHEHIPGATMSLQPGAAHFGALKILTGALKWAAGERA